MHQDTKSARLIAVCKRGAPTFLYFDCQVLIYQLGREIKKMETIVSHNNIEIMNKLFSRGSLPIRWTWPTRNRSQTRREDFKNVC